MGKPLAGGWGCALNRCALAFMLTLAGGLWGCAGNPSTGQPVADVVTPSDETEARKRARLRLELAVNYFDQGQTNVALDEVKQALAADPTFADAFNLRGLIYMRLNDVRQAEEGFKRALALNPRDPNTLHNYGWLMCQQRRFQDSTPLFNQALASPVYGDKAKTYMAYGVCLVREGLKADAERILSKAYELDAGNPITGYNLSLLLMERGELNRAQFYIRRLNNSEFANAESLWLGIKIERRLNDRLAMGQLGEQLKKRFPQSRELKSFERGAFDE